MKERLDISIMGRALKRTRTGDYVASYPFGDVTIYVPDGNFDKYSAELYFKTPGVSAQVGPFAKLSALQSKVSVILRRMQEQFAEWKHE